MTDYRLLIFDWDGTLVDSIGRIVEAVHRASDRCNLPRCTDEQARSIIGLGLPEAIRALYPEIGDEQLSRLYQRSYSDAYLQLETEPSALYDGVEDTLDRLRQQGFTLAVATGKTRRGLDRMLKIYGWQDYFEVTRCADETASKPDPRMLHEVMAHCGVTPQQSLMVGDSSFDLQMALHAGVDSVAAAYGAQPLAQLEQYRPKRVIHTFSELGNWLAR